MKRLRLKSLIASVAIALMSFAAAGASASPVTIVAADGVKVYGEFWPATASDAPLIVAFHQAGSSHAEYAPIAPRLHDAGFAVLAIDQRSGDGEFGGKNRTVAGVGRSGTYESAFADLEAALAWAQVQTNGAQVIVWGSSYSAALVFLLTAKHPESVRALLAFSPGEYLADTDAVRKAAGAVHVPVFVDQAKDGEEIEESRRILNAVAGADKTLFIPAVAGVHGSATLRGDRNAAGATENWKAVLAFLARFGGRPTR